MGTDVSAVALMHSTTDGMNAASLAIDWRPGERAVTTHVEHLGGIDPLYALRGTRHGSPRDPRRR